MIAPEECEARVSSGVFTAHCDRSLAVGHDGKDDWGSRWRWRARWCPRGGGGGGGKRRRGGGSSSSGSGSGGGRRRSTIGLVGGVVCVVADRNRPVVLAPPPVEVRVVESAVDQDDRRGRGRGGGRGGGGGVVTTTTATAVVELKVQAREEAVAHPHVLVERGGGRVRGRRIRRSDRHVGRAQRDRLAAVVREQPAPRQWRHPLGGHHTTYRRRRRRPVTVLWVWVRTAP